MFEIIIAALCIMAASLVGVFFVGKTAAKFLESKLQLLVSFSTGVFLVVAALFIQEVFHIFDSVFEGMLFILVGYGFATALQFVLPESHHHHGDECLKKGSARKIIVGDAIHNVADGIILVPAFMASTGLGIAVALSIFIHEALQEISEFFILRRAGYSIKKALGINLLVSSTVLLGVAIGWFSLSSEVLEGALLAISSGFFIHVLLHDLIPHTKQAGEKFTQAILFLILGAVTMLVINIALGETHTHEHEADDHAKEKNSQLVEDHTYGQAPAEYFDTVPHAEDGHTHEGEADHTH